MVIGFKNTTPAQRANPLGRVVEWHAALLAIWLAGTAMFLARALAGNFPRPLSSLSLIAVVVVAIMLVKGLRALQHGSLQPSLLVPKTALEWISQFAPTLGLILLAIGFTVAGAYSTGLVLLWVLVAGETLFGAGGPWTLPVAKRWLKRNQPDRGTTILEPPRQTIIQKTLAEPVAREIISRHDESAATDELPWLWQEETAQQELRYMTLPVTGLCIAGSQRITLPATQQTAVVHTVFHPAFDKTPVITIEMQEPETVAIKAAQILPHGIRWELRTEHSSDEPRDVQWAFSATTTIVPRG